jgi:hypothetical protein
MRPLKFHEQKLLKKVDFLQWKKQDNIRELQVHRMPCQAIKVAWLEDSHMRLAGDAPVSYPRQRRLQEVQQNSGDGHKTDGHSKAAGSYRPISHRADRAAPQQVSSAVRDMKHSKLHISSRMMPVQVVQYGNPGRQEELGTGGEADGGRVLPPAPVCCHDAPKDGRNDA